MKNENEKKIGTTIAFLISLMLLGSTIVNASINDNEQSIKENDIVFFDQTDTSVIVTIPVGEYEIINTEKGDEVNVEDFGRLLIPGKPNLPSKIFSIAIPPGTEVSDVNFDIGEGIMVTGIFEVPPSPLPRVIGEEDLLIYGQQKKMYDENFEFVYNYNDPYPDSIGEFVRTAGYRKYNLIDVRITPFTYLPLSGQLMYYPEITVEVTYVSSDEGKEIMVDNLITTERIAEEIIINYDQTKNWYTGQTVLGKGLHDFVIITLDSLTTSVTPLVNWENSKGRNVEVVTTSWINSNYPDGYDLAENMRNFLRDKYPSE